MKNLKSKILSSLLGFVGFSLVLGGIGSTMINRVDASANYTANWGTHELVQQSNYDLRDGATESQFISYGPSAGSQVWYSRSVANYYDLDKITVLTSYKGYDTLLKNGTYSTSTVKDQVTYATETLGYDVVGAINGTSFNTSTGAPNMGLMINGVEYCPGNYFSHGFFGIVKNEDTGDQKPVIGTASEYAAFRDGTVTTRTENNVEVDYTGYKMWQAIGGWYDALLINNGQICSTSTWDEEHPRTAIGITADGKVMTYVVEGRNGNRAGGMSLYHMASVMQELGCIYAINLDGGGSSTALSKHAGETTYGNRIQGAYGADRSVGDAILFVSTESMTDTGEEPKDEVFNKAHLLPNNDLFVVGTTINFTANGSNAYGDPVAIPDGAVWELDEEKSTPEIGSIDAETGVFTANGTISGNVYVNLKLENEIIGSTKVDLAWPSWSYNQAFATEFTLGFNEEKVLEFTLYPDGSEGNKNLGISTWRPMIVQECDLEWNLPEACSMVVNGDGEFVFVAGDVPVIDGIVSINKVKATGQTNVMTKQAVVSVGKAPQVLYDFEDSEWLDVWAAGGNSLSKKMYQSDNALFGNYSMAIDYDMSNGNYIGGMDPNKLNNRTVTFYNDKQGFNPVIPSDAKYFGMWVYFPEGLDGCWFRVTLQGYNSDGSGSLKTAATTLSDFISMPANPKVDQGIQDSGEWRFYYTEVGFDTRYGNSWSGITGPYGIYSCQIMWSAFADTLLGYDYNQPAGTTPEEVAANKEIARQKVEEAFEKAKIGTIYIDNMMALYGAPSRDMLSPYYNNISSTLVDDKYTLSLNVADDNRYDENAIAAFKYQDSGKLGDIQFVSGIDYSTLEVYLNGNKLTKTQYTLDEETGLISIPGLESLEAGTTVRIVALDKFTNRLDRTSTLREITIMSGEEGDIQETHLFWDREDISHLELPVANDRIGHYFAGWDGELPNVMPDKDIVIKAIYTPHLHDVTIVDTLGNSVAYYENIAYGSTIELPTIEGYTYSWVEGTNPVMPDNNVTLTVNKEINKHNYKVLFNGDVVVEEEVEYGEMLTLPNVSDREKEGHTFIGWDNMVSTMPDNDVTVNAVFSVNSYLVTIKDGENIVYSGKLPFNSTITLPESNIVGYRYAWAEGAVTTVPAEEHVVNVVREINKHTVTINNQNGGLIVELENVEYNSTIDLPEAPEGHTYAWAEGTVTTVPDSNVTLVVVDTVNKYQLTIEDENEVYFSEEVEYGSAITLPELEGYTFTWKEENVPATMPASALALEVIKSINKHTVTINNQNGGLIVELENVEYNSTIDLPEAPEGHTYAWAEGTVTTVPDSNVTLVVVDTVNKYQLTIEDENEVYFSGEVEYGSAITLPELEGYTFTWKEENVSATMPASALALEVIKTVNKHQFQVIFNDVDLINEERDYGTALELPNVSSLSNPGYTFTGWDIELPETMPDSDVVITALFSVNKYVVKLVDENGVLYDYFEQEYNTKINLPAIVGYTVSWEDGSEEKLVPVDGGEFVFAKSINSYRLSFVVNGNEISNSNLVFNSKIEYPDMSQFDEEGYAFAGWDSSLTRMPANDLTITARLIAKKYDVTFVDQDENVISVLYDVAFGSEIVLPVVEGYTITWPEGTENVTMPDQDVVFEIVKTANLYKLVFIYDEEEIYSEDVAFGSEITVPSLDNISKEGYTFVRWDKVIPSTMPANDLTITATFVINRVTVVFVDQNNELLAEYKELRYGDPLPVPTQSGYELSWPEGNEITTVPGEDSIYTLNKVALIHQLTIVDQNGEEVEVREEVSYESKIELPIKEGYTITWAEGVVPVMPNSDTVLQVNIVVNKYNVSFYFGEIELSSKEVAYGDVIEVPSTLDYYKEGYTFVGWDEEVPETMVAKDLVFNAEFVINSFDAVIINLDDNSIIDFLFSVEYGTQIELPTQEGYTYAWAENETGIMPDHDALIYVTKTVNKHKVTIKDEKENVIIEYENVPYGTQIKLPTQEGYTYAWAEDETGIMPDYDVSVYVTKTINTHKVTIVDQNGNFVVIYENVEYGSEIKLPSVDGYIVKWAEDNKHIMPDKDVTLAVDKIKRFLTITFIYDGKVVESKEIEYGANIIVPNVETLIPQYHVFGGWDSKVPETMPSENLTFNAVSVLDTKLLDNKVAAINNASSLNDKFVAIKDFEIVIKSFSVEEKIEYDSYVQALQKAKSDYNDLVNKANSDLDVASDAAGWVVFGFASSVALLAAGYFLMKRGLI